jgi:hypothetical protein
MPRLPPVTIATFVFMVAPLRRLFDGPASFRSEAYNSFGAPQTGRLAGRRTAARPGIPAHVDLNQVLLPPVRPQSIHKQDGASQIPALRREPRAWRRKQMFQVRIHGRGGQGVVSGAEMLSVAAFLEGRYAQAFPSFGSERMGA